MNILHIPRIVLGVACAALLLAVSPEIATANPASTNVYSTVANVAPATKGVEISSYFVPALAWSTIVAWVTVVIRYYAPRLMPHLWRILKEVSFWVLSNVAWDAMKGKFSDAVNRLKGALPSELRRLA